MGIIRGEMNAIRVIGIPTYNTYTTLNLKSNINNYEDREETALNTTVNLRVEKY